MVRIPETVRCTAIVVAACAALTYPAVAKDGNGNGGHGSNGNGNSHSAASGDNHSAASGDSHSSNNPGAESDRGSESDRSNSQFAGRDASSLGGLNAANASPAAFAHAAPNSEIGRIAAYKSAVTSVETDAAAYAKAVAALNTELASDPNCTSQACSGDKATVASDLKTLDQALEKAAIDLSRATHKPITVSMIKALDAKLGLNISTSLAERIAADARARTASKDEDREKKVADEDHRSDKDASLLGALNAVNASPAAFAHAAANSEIGRIATYKAAVVKLEAAQSAYDKAQAALKAALATDPNCTSQSCSDAKATAAADLKTLEGDIKTAATDLAAAANKPISAEVVKLVDEKLGLKVGTELAERIATDARTLSASKDETPDKKVADEDRRTDKDASLLGALNAANASPAAFAHAAANSEVGRIATYKAAVVKLQAAESAYDKAQAALKAALATDPNCTSQSCSDAKATAAADLKTLESDIKTAATDLGAAANKPITVEVVSTVDEMLGLKVGADLTERVAADARAEQTTASE